MSNSYVQLDAHRKYGHSAYINVSTIQLYGQDCGVWAAIYRSGQALLRPTLTSHQPASQLWRRQKTIETHYAMVGNHNQSLKFSELNSVWFEEYRRRRIFIWNVDLTSSHNVVVHIYHTLTPLTSPLGYSVIYMQGCHWSSSNTFCKVWNFTERLDS